MNKCISFGIFLNKLKIAKVIPLYKSGQADLPGNYRPISLLSLLSKIFERLFLNRLVSFFEQSNILIPTQLGFRHNHSTLHPILNILTDCLDTFYSKNFYTLIFLDIKKAYDSVCHKTLIKKFE